MEGRFVRTGRYVARAGTAALCAALLLGVATPAGLAASRDDIAPAKELLDAEDWTEALAAARDVLAAEPKDPQAHYIAGVASFELGRLNEAERHLDKTLRAAPEAPEVHYRLGRVLLAMADDFFDRDKTRIALSLCDEALDHFEAELERAPEHEGALGGRATALLAAGREDAAIQAYEAWIAAVPDSADGHIALIELYARAERADEALERLEAMPRVDPAEEAAAVFLVARTFYRLERPDEGRPLLSRLRELPARPWQVPALDALDRLSVGAFHAAAASLLEFLRSDPPADEVAIVARAYHDQYREMSRSASESLADGGIPKLSLRVAVEYPSDARRYAVEGEVLLLAIVEQDGSVGEMSVVSSTASRHGALYEPQFEQAALDSVRQWRYEPATREGQATAFPVTVSLTFERE